MLQETSTGAQVATCVQRVTATRELRHITGKRKWKFDWEVPLANGFDVYCLRTVYNHEVQGLIALKVIREERYVVVDILEKAPSTYDSSGQYEFIGEHLIAIAAELSFTHGFEGYVLLVSKSDSKLIAYYEKIGFRRVGYSRRMVMLGRQSARLLENYPSRRC